MILFTSDTFPVIQYAGFTVAILWIITLLLYFHWPNTNILCNKLSKLRVGGGWDEMTYTEKEGPVFKTEAEGETDVLHLIFLSIMKSI